MTFEHRATRQIRCRGPIDGEVRLLARSDASAWQGEERAQTYCSKVEGGAPDRIRVTTDANDLAGCDLVVEAVIEDMEAKIDLLHELGDLFPGADLASTTSSLPVAELAARCGHPDRVFGLHFFNPVPRMELVERPPSGYWERLGYDRNAWVGRSNGRG